MSNILNVTLFSGDHCLLKSVLTTGLSTNLPVPMTDIFALTLDRSGIFGLLQKARKQMALFRAPTLIKEFATYKISDIVNVADVFSDVTYHLYLDNKFIWVYST